MWKLYMHYRSRQRFALTLIQFSVRLITAINYAVINCAENCSCNFEQLIAGLLENRKLTVFQHCSKSIFATNHYSDIVRIEFREKELFEYYSKSNFAKNYCSSTVRNRR